MGGVFILLTILAVALSVSTLLDSRFRRTAKSKVVDPAPATNRPRMPTPFVPCLHVADCPFAMLKCERHGKLADCLEYGT
jgi:hypothetical protein